MAAIRGGIQSTSAPVVSHGIVVVGSSIDDNQRVDAPRGTVHAYDAMTGARWSFDPIRATVPPRQCRELVGRGRGDDGCRQCLGADVGGRARGLVFLPTTSPSPDFFGGDAAGRQPLCRFRGGGACRDGTSRLVVPGHPSRCVGLRRAGATDAWALVTYKGQTRAGRHPGDQAGLLFTLDRDTGAPLIPVEERRVPQGGAPGEQLSPTQPFPIAPKPSRARARPDDAFGLTFWDRGACRDRIAKARRGDLHAAVDQGHDPLSLHRRRLELGRPRLRCRARHRLCQHVERDASRHPHSAKGFRAAKRPPSRQGSLAANRRALRHDARDDAFAARHAVQPAALGQLHAIDMHDGHVLWEVPLGTTEDLLPFSEYLLGKTGTPNFGGPIVTAGGLVFIGAAMDDYLRAFDAKTGAELWRGRLPAGGQATPMTLCLEGPQYVVIAAGGHSKSQHQARRQRGRVRARPLGDSRLDIAQFPVARKYTSG
jgi:quinoprotein glucose dehydrogenase